MKGATPILVLLLVGFLIWYLYSKLKDFSFAWGDQGGGHGPGGAAASENDGSSNTAAGGSANPINVSKASGDGEKPVFIPRSKATLKATIPPLTLPVPILASIPAVISKLSTIKPADAAMIDGIAKRLSKANKDAAKYQFKSGTTGNINKSLAELKTLSDPDFIRVFNAWKALDKIGSALDSNIGSAMITNGDRSIFLTRLVNLKLV